jgi:hypothetical protein
METASPVRAQYWVELEGRTHGPCAASFLRRLRGFTLNTPLRCGPAGPWAPAFKVVDLKAYFAPSVNPSVSMPAYRAPVFKTTLQQHRYFVAEPQGSDSLVRTARVLTLLAAALVLSTLHFVPMTEFKAKALQTQKRLQPVIQRSREMQVAREFINNTTQKIQRSVGQWQKKVQIQRQALLTARRKVDQLARQQSEQWNPIERPRPSLRSKAR